MFRSLVFSRLFLVAGILLSPMLPQASHAEVTPHQLESLELAIRDLNDNHPRTYRGESFLQELEALRKLPRDSKEAEKRFWQLRREALLANPLLDFQTLLLLKRAKGQLGLPTNHQCNSMLEMTGWDNEIALLKDVREPSTLTTLYRPPEGEYVGEFDLDYEAEKLLFTMPDLKTDYRGQGTLSTDSLVQSRWLRDFKNARISTRHDGSWQIFEIGIDGAGLRRVTRDVYNDVDNFDGCYLPDGKIVYSSTASFHAVPCWHGKERACAIFRMNADGTDVRQLTFDQDLDLHPMVLPTGQVIYSRWDYTGTMHMYMRPLMVMNPDGTGQRAVYGSNSYWPNGLYFPRAVPGKPNRLISILAGYHSPPRMGKLALLDLTQGWYEEKGVVQMIPGRGERIEPTIRDNLTGGDWPQFLHPYPLNEKYYLVAMKRHAKANWGIFLVDVFDNLVPLLQSDRHDFFEPIPVTSRRKPPVIPDRTDLESKTATVYLHDIYAGPGLEDVPRGTVKELRIVGYHFGYPGMAGPDKIGIGGPWEVMRILGTVPIDEDGSVAFTIPAKTPIALQPLDQEGKAVQLMRSWFAAMPGEVVSCVGCHEQLRDVPQVRFEKAAVGVPKEIEPWYGPARGFDFEREVQPVLDAYCVDCHNEEHESPHCPDLRAERFFPDYQGRTLNELGARRLHPKLEQHLGGKKVKYTPAYEALIPYIRRVGIEDNVRLLTPGEYHADTSELVQMLQRGHYGVRLDEEAWDRLCTWIDMNGPCHGTWSEVGPIPDRAHHRRLEVAALYRGIDENWEIVPPLRKSTFDHTEKAMSPETAFQKARRPKPSTKKAVDQKRTDTTPIEPLDLPSREVALGDGVTLRLVRLPVVEDDKENQASLWMGVSEVTHRQYLEFDATHESGFFMKRYPDRNGPGLSLEGDDLPVTRVSWNQADRFCQWLSKKTDLAFRLPTGEEWTRACRAGCPDSQPMFYGSLDDDFSRFANMADRSLSLPPPATGGVTSNIMFHGNGVFLSALKGNNIRCETRFDDRFIATSPVGSFRPNRWGLHDMHGNVAEWTSSAASWKEEGARDEMAVRGGSFRDRPERCRIDFELSFPKWQRVHNVGFRVVATSP
jgi:formylglycine-generating enzyme required for sulfatase activity